MIEEYNAIMRNKTWVLIDPPLHPKVIGNFCVYRTKEKRDETFD